MTTPTYEQDLYGWTQAQAEALAAQDWGALDLDHLMAELKSLGGAHVQAVANHLTLLLTHLLQWAVQPQGRTRHWRTTIRVARQQLAGRLRRSPSLRAELPRLLADAYGEARTRAMRHTGRPPTTFPKACPWPLARVLDEDFWPGEGPS
ncbi:MAG TPA: DUF29 domain-containing protein [Candidatus Tectomicrobia bacterium]